MGGTSRADRARNRDPVRTGSARSLRRSVVLVRLLAGAGANSTALEMNHVVHGMAHHVAGHVDSAGVMLRAVEEDRTVAGHLHSARTLDSPLNRAAALRESRSFAGFLGTVAHRALRYVR